MALDGRPAVKAVRGRGAARYGPGSLSEKELEEQRQLSNDGQPQVGAVVAAMVDENIGEKPSVLQKHSPARRHSSPARRQASPHRRQRRSRERGDRSRKRRSRSARRSRSRRRTRRRSRSRSRSRSTRRRSRSRSRSVSAIKPVAPDRLSADSTHAGQQVREELARRWADVSVAKKDPIARMLQQSIQTRANLMQRRAQRNLSRTALAKDAADAGNADAAAGAMGLVESTAQPAGFWQAPQTAPQPAGIVTGGLVAPMPVGPVTPAPVPAPVMMASMPGVAMPGVRGLMPRLLPPGISVSGSAIPGLHCGGLLSVGGSASSTGMTNLALSTVGSAPAVVAPGASVLPARPVLPMNLAQLPRPRTGLTNSELDRLFAAPAYMGYSRLGPLGAQRLNFAAAQRQNSSGFLQTWDTVGNDGVTTIANRDAGSHTEEQKQVRAKAVLAKVSCEKLAESIEGEPCSICQEYLLKGQDVRRLPCAHIFHSECITQWLHVKLTCPLDNLPVDEGLEMLASEAFDVALQGEELHALNCLVVDEADDAHSSRAPPPPPLSLDSPPLPPCCPPSLPPLGLCFREAASNNADVSSEQPADTSAAVSTQQEAEGERMEQPADASVGISAQQEAEWEQLEKQPASMLVLE